MMGITPTCFPAGMKSRPMASSVNPAAKNMVSSVFSSAGFIAGNQYVGSSC